MAGVVVADELTLSGGSMRLEHGVRRGWRTECYCSG